MNLTSFNCEIRKYLHYFDSIYGLEENGNAYLQ